MNKVEQSNPITEGVIWKALLFFFFPILLGTFFQQMYNTVDAVIVGRFVGTEALAAVGGATGTLINLFVGFFTGLSSGATVILSQHFGAGNALGVRHTVHTAAAMALSFGLFLTVFGIAFTPAMLRGMGLNEQIMVYAVPYMRIYFAGMIPSLVYNIGTGLLRAIGDSRRPTIFLIVACLTNILLDLVFVLGLKMGVSGAAGATILSQAVSAVLVVVTLVRSKEVYQLSPRKIRFHGSTLLKVVRIGLPAGLQSVLFSVSNILIQSAINRFDTSTQAAYTAYGKLDCLIWMIVNAFGISVTTFSGQNFGAGKLQRVRKGASVCLLMSAGATACIAVILILFRRELLGLFTVDETVIENGCRMVLLLIPFTVIYMPVEIYSGTVRGTGDSLAPTVITLVGICFLRILWIAFVLPMSNTPETLLRCYPVTWGITSVGFVIYYHFSGWMKRSMRRT